MVKAKAASRKRQPRMRVTSLVSNTDQQHQARVTRAQQATLITGLASILIAMVLGLLYLLR